MWELCLLQFQLIMTAYYPEESLKREHLTEEILKYIPPDLKKPYP